MSSSLTAVREDGRMSSPGPRSGGPTSRRSFTSTQKLDHLAAYEAAAQNGRGGAYLRSHGLYSSLISEWRRLRDAGVLAGKQPGRRSGGSPASRLRSPGYGAASTRPSGGWRPPRWRWSLWEKHTSSSTDLPRALWNGSSMRGEPWRPPRSAVSGGTGPSACFGGSSTFRSSPSFGIGTPSRVSGLGPSSPAGSRGLSGELTALHFWVGTSIRSADRASRSDPLALRGHRCTRQGSRLLDPRQRQRNAACSESSHLFTSSGYRTTSTVSKNVRSRSACRSTWGYRPM